MPVRKRPGFGSLLIIGGHEDKEGDKTILRMLAKKVGKSGKVVVAPVASGGAAARGARGGSRWALSMNTSGSSAASEFATCITSLSRAAKKRSSNPEST